MRLGPLLKLVGSTANESRVLCLTVALSRLNGELPVSEVKSLKKGVGGI